jgi:hypothetical protein
VGRGRVAELRDRVREWFGLVAGVCKTLWGLVATVRDDGVLGDPLAFFPPSFPLSSARDCVTDNGEEVTGLVESRADLPCCFCAPRVCLFSDAGWDSTGTALVREDLRFPSSKNDVGPSKPAFFQGGDGGRGVERGDEVESVSLRFFDGGSSGCGTASTPFGSEGIDSWGAESGVLSISDPLRDLKSGTGVTRSSWVDGPSGLPFCMTCSHGRQGPIMAGDPSYPSNGAVRVK